MIPLSSLPGAARLQRTTTWRKLRHKLSLWTNDRTNSHFTGFLRLASQFEALVGPVIAHVDSTRLGSAPLRIAVLGCSNGAEAYTISSVLVRRQPGLSFRVYGYDIDPGCVAKAGAARYEADEIYNNKIIPEAFVEATFERHGTSYSVRPRIAEHVEFALADVLGAELRSKVGVADIVFAQNFLFHLKRNLAREALDNIFQLLRPGSALFIDGVDLDLRHRFVRARGLLPLEFKIEEIHDEARRARAVGWPYDYWGLEPFMTYRRNASARYATIFLAS